MFSAIVFAIKIIIAASLVVPLFISKTAVISRNRIGVYSIVSIVAATITAISDKMDSGLIAASLVVAIGIVSFSQFQKQSNWMEALKSTAPLWLVTAIGMSVGAGMLLQAVILTAVAYYVLNYLPTLIGAEKDELTPDG